jgi:hypothetical protein
MLLYDVHSFISLEIGNEIKEDIKGPFVLAIFKNGFYSVT